MPKWVLPLLIIVGLYVLSVGPLVTYFSRESAGSTMVPTWLLNYGKPYLWLYGESPQQVQDISDGYFNWCKSMMTKSEKGVDTMKKQVTPRPPPPFGF